ncbi:MAG: helix-hairpin-helix domain-containing protein [Gemmatimonadales bacterium]
MGTPGERKALLFLGAVIVMGGSVRVARAVGGKPDVDPAARAAIEKQIAAVDSARKHGSKKGKGRRAKRPEVIVPAVIDMDVASADEIETLRGIGPTLARRIVADRDSLGPFGSLDQLKRVKGVGPKVAARIDSSVTFSLLPRPSSTESSGSSDPPPGRRRPRRGERKN